MVRELHIHVEEPSMEAFLQELLPRMLTTGIPVKIIDHQSKHQLLSNLPKRLRGYAHYELQYRPRSLILVDRDGDDCVQLKQMLENAATEAGLATKSVPSAAGLFDVANRIVIEELEAWYFGDVQALSDAFPGVPITLNSKAAYRSPDAIVGGTHESLLRVLQKAGHYKGLSSLPKIETARRIGRLVDPSANTSASFGHFRAALTALAQQFLGVPNG